MADNLDHFDDLPKRDPNHVTEEKAQTAFQGRLAESGRFILQRADRKDYGTDCEIEIVQREHATQRQDPRAAQRDRTAPERGWLPQHRVQPAEPELSADAPAQLLRRLSHPDGVAAHMPS